MKVVEAASSSFRGFGRAAPCRPIGNKKKGVCRWSSFNNQKGWSKESLYAS